jgi:prepilin-type N-terminal cleavage/methylation domain-containing protein
MKRTPSGFTLIELVVVILVGSILVGVAISSFQNAQAGYAARNGRVMYETLHQLARARSIEMGQTMRLIVDASGDSAYILHIDSTVTDVTHFRDELGVDLVSNPSRFLICMTPRGYADPDCPALPDTAISIPVFLGFKQAGDSSVVVILPMGQLLEL